MRRPALSLLRDERGTAVEFAMVLPLTLLLLFGIIEVGLYGWTINRAEKATQAGARQAVVTNVVASNLAATNYVGVNVGGTVLTQGDPVPAGALGLITCTSTGCTCEPGPPCPDPPGFDATAFNQIVARMASLETRITAANVVVEYRGSGLGFAGDPGGMDIAPLTTVRLRDMTFTPATTLLVGAQVPLPSFSYTLTMEDGSGSASF